MKKIFVILTLLFMNTVPLLAQESPLHQRPLLNYERKASDYQQTNARGFSTYKTNFDHAYFMEVIDQLKQGDKVLDAGAGFGTALIELVANPHHKTFIPTKDIGGKAINAQDFWGYLQKEMYYLTPDSLILRPFKGYDQVGPFKISTLSQIFDALGIEPMMDLSTGLVCENRILNKGQYVRMLQSYIQDALNVVNKLKKEKKFEYVVDQVQSVLKKDIQKGEKYKLILDVYGAEFYSPHRIELFELYYEVLSPGGTALIILGPTNNLPQDHVLTKKGEKIELLTYLTNFAPSLFEVHHARGGLSILKIKKSPSLGHLKLPLRYDESEIQFGDKRDHAAIQRGFTYPHHLLYHEFH